MSDDPNINFIIKADLTEDKRLVALYFEFVKRRMIRATNIAFLDFAGYAEKAVEEDTFDTPGRLFRALVKADEGRINQGQEERAMTRFPSHVREQIVGEAETHVPRNKPPPSDKRTAIGDAWAEITDRDVGFLPSSMVQCFFPQRRLPDDTEIWHTTHGKASVTIQRGVIPERDNPHEIRKCEIPHGYLARLLTGYIIGQVVRTKSRNIDMGQSIRDCLTRLNIPIDGPAAKRLTFALEDLAAASIILNRWNDPRGPRARFARIASEVSFWIPNQERARTFWNPQLEVSLDFFEQIREHRVPIDMNHQKALSKSPRRMDLYAWLAYRSPQVPKRRQLKVPLRTLQPIFAPDIANAANFKRKMKGDIEAIRKIYNYNTFIKGDALIVQRSSPPIPFKHTLQIPDSDPE